MNTKWGAAVGRLAGIVLAACASLGSAHAAQHAYLTGASEPWEDYSNQAAMSAAFGDDWDRLQYGDSFNSHALLYIDGGEFTSTEMVNYLGTNRRLLEDYVVGGGRLFINAATELQSTFELVFGATSTELRNEDRSYAATAVDPTSELFEGAGNQWNGYHFSHNSLSVPDTFSALIVDDAGRTVLSGGFFGKGYVMLGAQTNTIWHEGVNGSDPAQLRVNELRYTLNAATPPVESPIPEPGMYLMMLLGLAGVVLGVRGRA